MGDAHALVQPTTLFEQPRLSTRLGARITVASEVFQRTGSFKIRAASHLVSHVTQELFIAVSAGNFGQALAFVCSQLGRSCIIAMPKASPQVKIDAVKEFGGQVDLYDAIAKSGDQRVQELLQQYPTAYKASAFDDPLVIEGNSSLGRELARVAPHFDCIVVPVAGGGLIAGIIKGVQQEKAGIAVIGVEPVLANDAAMSFRAGHIVKLDHEPQTIADGVRSRSLGVNTWPIIKDGMADIVEVSEESICDALRILFSLGNTKAEPAGALSVAAVLSQPSLFAGRHVCCVVSGGNVDPLVYSNILSQSC